MEPDSPTESSSSEGSSSEGSSPLSETILYYAGLPYRPRRSSSGDPTPPSDPEAIFYYAGLPSSPRLVARSSTTIWIAPSFPEAYPIKKQLYPVYEHRIQEFWECGLAAKIHRNLGSMGVEWTSIDVVRIGEANDPNKSAFPIILWIGVVPGSLPRPRGVDVVVECRKTLLDHDISDIHVEIRESVVIRSTGPKLLPPPGYKDAMVDILQPLTTSVGFHISAKNTPYTEGTGGFFFTDGSDTKRLFLATARHVVFPPVENTDKERHNDGGESREKIESKDNELFQRLNDSDPRYEIMLFGDVGFPSYLKSLEVAIRVNRSKIEDLEDSIKSLEDKNDPDSNVSHPYNQNLLKYQNKARERLQELQSDLPACWSTPESRIIGHVILSPPITANDSNGGYYEDWAVIEIESSKVDSSNFRGNIMYMPFQLGYFPREVYRRFEEGFDDTLRLQGVIPDEEMGYPSTDEKDNKYRSLMVFKRGITTGLTRGRSNGVFSYTRENGMISKEWPILPYVIKSNFYPDPFSGEGDSGSVIADARGRIGGLLTGGSFGRFNPMNRKSKYFDISYATPISFLLSRMRDKGLRPNLDPVLT